MPNKYTKARLIFMKEAEERLEKGVTMLQSELWDKTETAINKLVTEEGKIVTSAKNYSIIGVFNKIGRELKGERGQVIRMMVKDLIAQDELVTKYFNDFLNLELKSVQTKVYNRLLDRIGYDGDGFVSRGTLFDLWEDDTEIRKVRAETVKAISGGRSWKDFQKDMKLFVNGTDEVDGVTKAHFRTNTFDVYAQNDRSLTKQYADEYELDYFIYQGGLMATTRPFCEARNGKVFTRKEIESWKDLKFQGKPKVYDPFIDCGGYNCRHTLDPISAELAKELKGEN